VFFKVSLKLYFTKIIVLRILFQAKGAMMATFSINVVNNVIYRDLGNGFKLDYDSNLTFVQCSSKFMYSILV
jgi:hypothetical protein